MVMNLTPRLAFNGTTIPPGNENTTCERSAKCVEH